MDRSACLLSLLGVYTTARRKAGIARQLKRPLWLALRNAQMGHHKRSTRLYEVTAIVRRPAAITLTHARLRVTTGDVLKPDSFAHALKQQDAVLSVIGVTGLKPMTFHGQSARNLVDQMGKAGVQRLVGVTSVGVLDKPVGPLFYIWLIKPLLRNIYDDMRHMEQTIRESHLTWTIVRPARLFDGKRTGQYRVGSSGELARANKISRADLAACILNQLETEANWQKAIAIAY